MELEKGDVVRKDMEEMEKVTGGRGKGGKRTSSICSSTWSGSVKFALLKSAPAASLILSSSILYYRQGLK